jgi:hypothetical protein
VDQKKSLEQQNMHSKLGLEVVQSTSESPGHPAAAAAHHAPGSSGWLSARFPAPPQVLVLAVAGGAARVASVQLLAHAAAVSDA